MQMRQSKREIKDEAELRAILDACKSCSVGLADGDQPYVVPMNFGYRWDHNGLILYFHSALEGRKLEILSRNNKTCVVLDHRHALRSGEKACQYSMNFESMMIFGRIDLVTDPQEQQQGLNVLMGHYTGRENWTFDEKPLAITAVLRMTAERWSGKRLEK